MAPEADLVADASAAEALFDQHWLTAWRAAYAVTGRTDLADDAAQDAFINAIRTFATYNRKRPFAPWIAKIAVNCARDLLRAERRQKAIALDEGTEAPRQADASGLLLAVAALPREQREAVVLHHVLGFTLKEVAEIVAAPEGTAASRLGRGVAAIRQTMEAEHAYQGQHRTGASSTVPAPLNDGDATRPRRGDRRGR
jgi:RNA polymerase sigma-70 factor, ECF subfamily